MLLPGPDLHREGLWHFVGFFTIFLPKVGEDQKKSHHLSAGPLAGTVPYFGKFGTGYCITFTKRLDEGLR